jgi:4-hydroxy-tetrahydrodipicolinate reductase
MSTPTRILIHGASGRMGQALLRLAAERSDLEIVAAVSRKIESRAVDGIPQFKVEELSGVPAFDVAIDFSLPEGFDGILAVCRSRHSALVSGTTGLSDAQKEALRDASGEIPVVWSANFSLGVAVLSDLVERAAAALSGWDCDIVESHHIHKKDAPSGTALALGASAERGGLSRATHHCGPGISWANIWSSSRRWANGSNWCTAPPTATSSRAERCMRRRACPDGHPERTNCVTYWTNSTCQAAQFGV